MVNQADKEPRVALVTGAARGLGRAIAMRLGADGYRMVLADIEPAVTKTQQALEAIGVKVLALQGDVSQYAFFEEAVSRAKREWGPIAILVNNAGITNNIAKTEMMSLERWQRELDVNLTSVFYGARSVLPGMHKEGWGRIINMSSVAAISGLDRQPGYAATKAGILGLTQTIALEYAAAGITCNAVLPGMIGTTAVKALPPELKEQTLKLIPKGSFGTPEDVAALVAFLASEQAGYITGAAIPIDGGAHLNPITLAEIRK